MSLIVDGWTREPSGAWVRRVTDDGTALGAVHFEGQAASWFPFLRRVRLNVFETDDASHLMTLIRSWGVRGSWHVRDAEDFHIGTVHRGRLITSEGVTLGHLENGQILNADDRELASFCKRSDNKVEMTFAREAMDNPFLRMLLLASVLVLEPMPE